MLSRSHCPYRRPLPRPLVCMLVLAALLGSACNDGFVSRKWMREQQNDYLTFATSEALRPTSILHVLNHLERARRDPSFAVAEGSVPPNAWNRVATYSAATM